MPNICISSLVLARTYHFSRVLLILKNNTRGGCCDVLLAELFDNICHVTYSPRTKHVAHRLHACDSGFKQPIFYWRSCQDQGWCATCVVCNPLVALAFLILLCRNRYDSGDSWRNVAHSRNSYRGDFRGNNSSHERGDTERADPTGDEHPRGGAQHRGNCHTYAYRNINSRECTR